MREIEYTAEIKTVRYTKDNQPSEKQLQELAKVYAEVFGGYPWYECNQCNGCKTFFGPDTASGAQCVKCNEGLLGEAYPKEETSQQVSSMFEESPGFVMHLLEKDSLVRGFVWGRPRDFVEYGEKYGEHFDKEVELQRKVARSNNFFSLAEIGVDSALRGKGLGQLLVDKMLRDIQELGLATGVWTRCDTILTPICLKKGFIQTYGPETVINNGKVELTGKTIIGSSNTTPERVFFIKP